jgi:co-chaperonin GroES (HSP10)
MKKTITKPVIPLGNNILIKPCNKVVEQNDGIFIPQTAQDASLEYEVVALGSGEFTVKVGDIVLPSKYDDGLEIVINDEMHKLITEADILAII